MPNRTDIDAIVEGLSEAQKRDVLDWDNACDCDWDLVGQPDDYFQRMEDAGFAYLDFVNGDDLEDSFAYVRGIEAGGMIYRLSPKGLSVRSALLEARERQA